MRGDPPRLFVARYPRQAVEGYLNISSPINLIQKMDRTLIINNYPPFFVQFDYPLVTYYVEAMLMQGVLFTTDSA